MRRPLLVLTAFAFVLLLVPVHAEDVCWKNSWPDVTIPDVDGRLGGDIYVGHDTCDPTIVNDCIHLFYVYQETNGVALLERGDDRHSDLEGCDGDPAPDTQIF